MQDMAGLAALAGAAAAGQFAVDHASGEQMVLSIARMRTQLGDVMTKLRDMTRELTPLGTLFEAQHVALQNQLVAVGDHQSATYVLAQFALALEHAEAAVRQGMANYEKIEDAAEVSFKQHESERLERRRRATEHQRGGMRAV